MAAASMKVLTCARIPDFVCTADKCPDNCCRLWSVNFYEDEYKKISEKFTDPGFGAQLKESIITDEKRSKNENRAVYKFKQNKRGSCVMLTGGGLCKIHKNLGPEYLVNICAMYPRNYNIYNGFYQSFLDPACPVAVKSILFNKNGIEFIITGTIYTKDILINNQPCTNSTLSEAVCYKIREVCFSLLQSNTAELPDKFMYIGQMLSEIDDTGGEDTAAQIIETYANRPGIAKSNITTNDTKYNTFLVYILTIFKNVALDGIRYSEQNTGFYKALKKISYRLADITGYKDTIINKKKELAAFFRENEYVFCNYLIYIMFIDRFAHRGAGVTYAYKKLAVNYALLIILISCVYDIKKDLSADDLIFCICQICQKLFHTNYTSVFDECYADIDKTADYASLSRFFAY